MPKPNPSPIKRTRRRFIRRLLGRTTLGFIIAILAALTAHAISEIHSKPPRMVLHPESHLVPGHHLSIGHTREAFGTSFVSLSTIHTPIPEQIVVDPLDTRDFSDAIRIQDLPAWVRKTQIEPYGAMQTTSVATLGAGVPFKMLRHVTMVYAIPSNPPPSNADKPVRTQPWNCPFKKDFPNPQALRQFDKLRNIIFTPPLRATVWGALDIHGPAHRFQQNHSIILPTQIPLTPIWPGLLANTAIYTALIWLTLWSLATLRRRIHRWRHPNAKPCTHCRYDLSGINANACPECGEPLPE